MKTSYAEAGPKQVLLNKTSNLLTMIGTVPSGGSLYGEGRLSKLRDIEFRYILFGLGAMNLGWLALLSSAFRKQMRKSRANFTAIKLMLGIAAVSLPLWALTLFGPDITVIHAGSYATMLLLFISLGAVISHLSAPWLKIMLTLQLIYFILVWVLGVFYGNTVDYIYVIWMVGAAMGIAICLRTLTKIKLTGLLNAASD
jgi:hypothetical protein